jgi:glucosamine--fructose-6-phosphate aminotransferase (isomerizing)
MYGLAMEREIREQPSILRAGPETYAPILSQIRERGPFEMVLLAARGSSDNAALYARYLFEVKLGIPVSLAAPSVWTRYDANVRYPKCLAIGISQSGAAPDVAEVLEHLKQAGHTTGAITHTPGSRLTSVAQLSILINAGDEKSIAATKTYSATLLSLYELVRELSQTLPEPVLPDPAWMAECFNSALIASGPVVRSSPIFCLSRGYGFSTAMETALKLMECSLIPAKAYSSADFEHGPKALAGPNSVAISYDGDKPHLTENGCEVILAPTNSAPDEIKPIWDVIFGQCLALLTARARGLDPDDARFLRKVTRTL